MVPLYTITDIRWGFRVKVKIAFCAVLHPNTDILSVPFIVNICSHVMFMLSYYPSKEKNNNMFISLFFHLIFPWSLHATCVSHKNATLFF